jgi:hypothetical protein
VPLAMEEIARKYAATLWRNVKWYSIGFSVWYYHSMLW